MQSMARRRHGMVKEDEPILDATASSSLRLRATVLFTLAFRPSRCADFAKPDQQAFDPVSFSNRSRAPTCPSMSQWVL